MEAQRALSNRIGWEQHFESPELHSVPNPQQEAQNIAEIPAGTIHASEHLEPMDARRERIVLYLLEQPNFSIVGNKVGFALKSLELTTNEWSKARTGLVQDYEILLNRDTGNGRVNRATLNVEKLLSAKGAPVFITTQVLKKFCDNIDLLEASGEDKSKLLEKVDLIMEARQKREKYLAQEASLPKPLTAEQKKQKRAEAEEIVKSKFPKQKPGDIKGNGVMTFRFDIGEQFFTTGYKPDEYSKLYPLHKFMLAAGLASTLNQETDEYLLYLQRLVNKGAKESSHYNLEQVQEIGKEAINLSLASFEEEKYNLSERAFDVLTTLALRRFSNFV